MAAVSSYQFGRFELNLRSYELKRDGQPLRLEKIPMDLLIFLVEHHGELITRDQIIDKLWGKQVFLDTEQGINTAIRKVRQVLHDEPEKPQFLETVVGKGYRFVGDVTASGGRPFLPRFEIARSHRATLAVLDHKRGPRHRGYPLDSVVADRSSHKAGNCKLVSLDRCAPIRKLNGQSKSRVFR
jgi:DNA-binding winged helix-turn-helix (wHTH) protein